MTTTPTETTVWNTLAGQEHAHKQLIAACANPNHAWLITGPPGSGRSNTALAFAAALNCSASHSQPGCGTCSDCRSTLTGTHPDVTVVETEKTTITIEEARALVVTAQTNPIQALRRIVIITDADRMSERTANVLLKALEEPPPRTIWILCAPNPSDVLITIRSRCQLIILRTPTVEAVATILTIQDGIEPQQARRAAQAAQRHIGIARRLARDEQARQRREHIVHLPPQLQSVSAATRAAAWLLETAKEEAQAYTAERDAAERTELLRTYGITESDPTPPAIHSQLRRLEEEQKRRSKRSTTDALDRALLDLLSFYRDALILQLGSHHITETDLINPGARHHVENFTHQTTPEHNLRCMEKITAVRRQIVTTNVAPLLALEALLVALSAPSPTTG